VIDISGSRHSDPMAAVMMCTRSELNGPNHAATVDRRRLPGSTTTVRLAAAGRAASCWCSGWTSIWAADLCAEVVFPDGGVVDPVALLDSCGTAMQPKITRLAAAAMGRHPRAGDGRLRQWLCGTWLWSLLAAPGPGWVSAFQSN
jgi:hypothetical protein